MKKTITLIAFVLAFTACGKSPIAPEQLQAVRVPVVVDVPNAPDVLHHNIPATDADGRLHYVCSTQPRLLASGDGVTLYERDHYLQGVPCPIVPID